MSEVEKLYVLAGVKSHIKCNRSVCNKDFHCKKRLMPDEECLKDLKTTAKRVYPTFTAEKQLELIKLLCQQCDLIISRFSKWEFVLYDGQEPIKLLGKDFTETLAKLVNTYWQDLTETEKSEIKRILENE